MMPVLSSHPPKERLVAFAQGRLPLNESAAIEQHVAECDQCCRVMADAPEDSLQVRLKAADTFDVAGESDTETSSRPTIEVPPELVEHPRYRIQKVLGIGGMGVVFRAEHRLMERPVALKVINRALLAKPEVVERFEQEVKAAAKLAHANIVVAHDAEQVGDLHFLVMEYVDGQSLAKIVEKKGPLPVVNACHYIRQAAQGLQHAHEKGMVHRDIKPQNLMLTKRGQIKVLDFGLARLRHSDDILMPDADRAIDEAQDGSLTRAGSLLGTPDYMAPEQAADPRDADARADLYSLGCTLYFLLTGQPPFASESALRKLKAHQHRAIKPVSDFRSDVPAELVAVLARLVAKEPSDRFQTAAEVVQAIAPLARGEGLSPASDSPLREAACQTDPTDVSRATIAHADDAEPQRIERARPVARLGRPRRGAGRPHWSVWLSRHYPRVIMSALGLLLLFIVSNEVRRSLTGPHTSDSTANIVQTDRMPELIRGESPERSDVAEISNTRRPALVAGAQRVGLVVWSEGYSHQEYVALREALDNRGARVVVISDAARAESAWETGQSVTVDLQLADVNPQSLDAMVILGGKSGVFRFFESREMQSLLDKMLTAKKSVAGIGGGVAVLVKGGYAKQHRIAVGREMQSHAERYGAQISDEIALRDGLLVTARDAGGASELARLLTGM